MDRPTFTGLKSGKLLYIQYTLCLDMLFFICFVFYNLHSTVDAFQGREADVVIFSCVRATGKRDGGSGIGFLSDVQRMNVALTRARHFLFVITRRRSIMANPYWRNLVGYARMNNALLQVPLLVPMMDEKKLGSCSSSRSQHPNTITVPRLKSSLIKSSFKKKVSFGGVDERLYEVGSASVVNEVEDDLFPDLTSLVPLSHEHHTTATSTTQGDANRMSDSDCSA